MEAVGVVVFIATALKTFLVGPGLDIRLAANGLDSSDILIESSESLSLTSVDLRGRPRLGAVGVP